MSRALVPMVEGFEDIEAVSIIDVLRRGGVEVVTASLGASLEVKSAHNIRMKADSLLTDVVDADYDAIVLPGGPGTPGYLQSETLIKRIFRQKDEDKLISAICAAPTVLVEIGVVDEMAHITCYPSCAVDLDRPVASVPCVEDVDLITGQAPGSATLFALVVLKRLEGEAIARKVARGMVTDVL